MTEGRIIHGLTVGIERDVPTRRGSAIVLTLPDGHRQPVRIGAYENVEDAIAAEVAVWGIRKNRERAGMTAERAPRAEV